MLYYNQETILLFNKQKINVMENLSTESLTIIIVIIAVFIVLFFNVILLLLGYVIGTIFGLPIYLLRNLFKKTLNYDLWNMN